MAAEGEKTTASQGLALFALPRPAHPEERGGVWSILRKSQSIAMRQFTGRRGGRTATIAAPATCHSREGGDDGDAFPALVISRRLHWIPAFAWQKREREWRRQEGE